MRCPRCQVSKKQYRAGLNPSGSQRYRCGECHKVYTPQPTLKGYSLERRMLALRMYVEGSSQRSIARILKVSPQTVANWINSYVERLPSAQVPAKPRVAELDELYTFLKNKKTRSTFSRSSTEPRIVFWVGTLSRKEPVPIYRNAWSRLHRHNNIIVMLFRFTIRCTMVLLTRCELTKTRPIRWRLSTQICVTTWNA